MKNIIIAIDGFSGTGKSTIAKKVAQKLGYIYIDSGAMYRAITLLAIQNNLVKNVDNHIVVNEQELISLTQNADVQFKFIPELASSQIFLNGQNIESQIRGLSVSNAVSAVAKIPQIRKILVDLQRNMGKNKGIVMDGRDIASVVFPSAELKIFMSASDEVRASRRYQELIQKGENVTLQEVLNNLKERDLIDSSRSESPLIKTPDAIQIDNSNTTIEQIVEQIVNLASAL